MAATPLSEVASRTAIESGGSTTSVRFWAAPTYASDELSRAAGTRWGTVVIADGSASPIPMPWRTRATTNGTRLPPGSTPGSSRMPLAAR